MTIRKPSKKQLKEYADFKKTVGEFILSIGGTFDAARWYPYELQTSAGVLSISPSDNWIACRFADVARAKAAKIAEQSFFASLNPFSGKWNFLAVNGDTMRFDGQVAFDYFKSDMARCFGFK
jgi:hypothetical protein